MRAPIAEGGAGPGGIPGHELGEHPGPVGAARHGVGGVPADTEGQVGDGESRQPLGQPEPPVVLGRHLQGMAQIELIDHGGQLSGERRIERTARSAGGGTASTRWAASTVMAPVA